MDTKQYLGRNANRTKEDGTMFNSPKNQIELYKTLGEAIARGFVTNVHATQRGTTASVITTGAVSVTFDTPFLLNIPKVTAQPTGLAGVGILQNMVVTKTGFTAELVDDAGLAIATVTQIDWIAVE